LADTGKRHRALMLPHGQIDHGGYRKPPLSGQSHGWIPIRGGVFNPDQTTQLYPNPSDLVEISVTLCGPFVLDKRPANHILGQTNRFVNTQCSN
jgi:hypothetical protein